MGALRNNAHGTIKGGCLWVDTSITVDYCASLQVSVPIKHLNPFFHTLSYGELITHRKLLLDEISWFFQSNETSPAELLHSTQGERCLQGNRWVSRPASMTSRLASVTFKMASKVFVEETDKNFEFITEILFRFLGFGDFKIPIVIENQTLVLFGMKRPLV